MDVWKAPTAGKVKSSWWIPFFLCPPSFPIPKSSTEISRRKASRAIVVPRQQLTVPSICLEDYNSPDALLGPDGLASGLPDHEVMERRGRLEDVARKWDNEEGPFCLLFCLPATHPTAVPEDRGYRHEQHHHMSDASVHNIFLFLGNSGLEHCDQKRSGKKTTAASPFIARAFFTQPHWIPKHGRVLESGRGKNPNHSHNHNIEILFTSRYCKMAHYLPIQTGIKKYFPHIGNPEAKNTSSEEKGFNASQVCWESEKLERM